MDKILIIGSLNMDMVANVDHTPLTGETILTSEITLVSGGKGANQAYAAGRLRADVTMFGAVGEDSYGKTLLDSLTSAGVDAAGVLRRKDAATGMAFITVNKEGDNSIVVVSGANATLSKEDIDAGRALIENTDILLLQMEIPVETVCHAAQMAKSMGKTVILDPAPVPEHFPVELYRYIDVIKPNETELYMLTGMNPEQNSIEEAAGWIRSRGVRNVLVTLGAAGVYLDSEEVGTVRIPAVAVHAVDTTAAGDAFTAAVAVKMAQGENLLDAAVFANQVSSIVVTRKGAQSSIPALEEVETYLQCAI